jgi:hypothetical protein
MFVLNLQFQVVFGKLEKYQTGWAHLSATVFEPPRADRMPDVQIAAAATTLLSPPVLSTALPSPPVLATTLPSPPVLTAYKARGGQDELPLFTSSLSTTALHPPSAHPRVPRAPLSSSIAHRPEVPL